MQPITHLYTQACRWTLVATVLAYISGVIWLLLPPMRQGALAMTPYIMLLSLLTLLLNQHKYHEWGFKAISYYIGCYLFTVGYELIRVNTNLPLGTYRYGNGLGVELWHTPLITGCNWLIQLIILRDLATQYRLRGSYRVVVASLLMVAYNLMVDQVVPFMNMWQLEGEHASILNYISCMTISLFLLSWGERIIPSNRQNPAAIPLLSLQLALLATEFIHHCYTR